MNKAIIYGNLGQDPESRTTASGTVVCNLRVAVNERVKRGDNWEDHVEWFSVAVFGRTAENCTQYLRKGSKVLIEGKIRTRKWQDKEGNDRWSTEIIGDRVTFGGKPEGQGSGRSGGGNSRGGYGAGGAGAHHGKPDDDVPF